MRKLTQEMRLKHWLVILQERTDSGKSIRGYCRERGINEKSYYYWQRRLREKAAEMTGYSENTMAMSVANPKFVEINQLGEESPVEGRITIRIGNAVVEIDGFADPQTIEAVLKSLC